MKKNIIIAIASAAMVLFASCQKTPISAEKGFGYLSFSEFTLGLDETVETKATAASGNYTITIIDADGNEVMRKTYDEVKKFPPLSCQMQFSELNLIHQLCTQW